MPVFDRRAARMHDNSGSRRAAQRGRGDPRARVGLDRARAVVESPAKGCVRAVARGVRCADGIASACAVVMGDAAFAAIRGALRDRSARVAR
jgi:hypothetical protein